jgi:hypothetical protein
MSDALVKVEIPREQELAAEPEVAQAETDIASGPEVAPVNDPYKLFESTVDVGPLQSAKMAYELTQRQTGENPGKDDQDIPDPIRALGHRVLARQKALDRMPEVIKAKIEKKNPVVRPFYKTGYWLRRKLGR